MVEIMFKISIWMNFSTPCIFIFSVAPLLPLVLLKLPILLNQKSFHIWFLGSTQNCREPNLASGPSGEERLCLCVQKSLVFSMHLESAQDGTITHFKLLAPNDTGKTLILKVTTRVEKCTRHSWYMLGKKHKGKHGLCLTPPLMLCLP